MGQVLELSTRRRQAPTAENGKVAPPRRRPNRDLRTREYLTPTEAERLMAAAPPQDATVTRSYPAAPHVPARTAGL